MLAAIAINETAKISAFPWIDSGYAQARQCVQCPVCGAKYLLLLDGALYQPSSSIGNALQARALDYFSESLREIHATGHAEKQLVMSEP